MVILLESFLAKLFVIEVSYLPGNVNLSAGGEIPLNCLPIHRIREKGNISDGKHPAFLSGFLLSQIRWVYKTSSAFPDKSGWRLERSFCLEIASF